MQNVVFREDWKKTGEHFCFLTTVATFSYFLLPYSPFCCLIIRFSPWVVTFMLCTECFSRPRQLCTNKLPIHLFILRYPVVWSCVIEMLLLLLHWLFSLHGRYRPRGLMASTGWQSFYLWSVKAKASSWQLFLLVRPSFAVPNLQLRTNTVVKPELTTNPQAYFSHHERRCQKFANTHVRLRSRYILLVRMQAMPYL